MSEYISPAEITRLVKSALRKAFPDSKFQVSSHNQHRGPLDRRRPPHRTSAARSRESEMRGSR